MQREGRGKGEERDIGEGRDKGTFLGGKQRG